ncbi:class I SAM-dependent methyltransferase [Stappia sp. MMSF_3263]|uniref:class I SAM-dependent methyltransferase n=1 Tax=Stappia sp. MMSF_3263 TaxID=3046693 RepID=UPI00273DB96F|nr:class I SAM-dependent methyltransferase [Stappia sp. MMSF_3263]
MNGNPSPAPEDFAGVQALYDETMADNAHVHDLIYPHVFGPDQYIGQFSDNSANELRLMGSLMQLAPGSRVLDLGCGRGLVAAFLAREMEWSVTGIDLSLVSVAAGRDRDHDVELIAGNVYEHAFPDPFDGIYSTGAACHFDAARLFARARALLRPGGRLAIFERTRLGDIDADDWNRLTRDWKCPHVYTTQEYGELLAVAGFRVRHVVDTTERFRLWQERSVDARKALREEIVAATSPDYFETSLALAAYEHDVSKKGLLGYAAVIAEAVS